MTQPTEDDHPWNCEFRDRICAVTGAISDLWIVKTLDLGPLQLMERYLRAMIAGPLGDHLDDCLDCKGGFIRLIQPRRRKATDCPTLTEIRDSAVGLLFDRRKSYHIDKECSNCRVERDALRRAWAISVNATSEYRK